ncbi:MAG: AraC family transcriptional regulator [Bacteroidales bacterium]|nr:AraC family transcriptional regulator [Bacteroidales bacterium]MCF8343417.1 AraC family transcriptional regulator [Bacteroidales bacterium]MCF8349857.1 AraC family transcriptional regulator [Bacteroidales bacterium]MCF8375547.1 AraC family transcriptional regulator [Bacteroidales bacterium]MCF8399946.1 AraC family transcriptional regulator [Bacteroidales bacterium]
MTGKESTIQDYHERINKVLIYINDHLDEKMELKKLADISSFSTFHFHRIMRAYLNESLGSFLLRLRLDKAAGLLEYTELTTGEVAWKVGSEVPSSFNKAFKKRFGISPVEYRNGQRMKFRTSELKIQNKLNMEIQPKIKELKPRKVIYVTKNLAKHTMPSTGFGCLQAEKP